MGNDRTFKLTLSGLDCANCANKIEDRVNRLELVEEANLEFFNESVNSINKRISA